MSAVQWFNPGDHPHIKAFYAEQAGPQAVCPQCHELPAYHGILGRRMVCPGTYVVPVEGHDRTFRIMTPQTYRQQREAETP